MNLKIKELLNSAKVIDTHAHVVLSETEGAAGKFGPEVLFDGDTPVYRIGDYSLRGVNYRGTAFMDPKIRLEKMNEAKIDVQVLTPNPLTYFHYIEASVSIEFSKIHNISGQHFAGLPRGRWCSSEVKRREGPHSNSLTELKRLVLECPGGICLLGGGVAESVAKEP